MIECYSVFCAHHNEAIGFYKEQLQNNKKLQILIQVSRSLPRLSAHVNRCHLQ